LVQETKVSLNPLASNEWVAKEGKKTCTAIFDASKIVLALCWVFQLVKNFDETCDANFCNVCNCEIQSEIEGFDVFMGGFTSPFMLPG